ncbi:hypothetical protein [Roseibium sp. M-1]
MEPGPSDIKSTPNDLPLTQVQKLVVRAALSEEEFSYLDLADLTGRSLGNLRKIKSGLNDRFPDIFVEVGREEAEIGRKSSLWSVNPKYVKILKQLTSVEAVESQRRMPRIEEFPILGHVRSLLDSVHGVEPDKRFGLVLTAQNLIERTQKTFDAVIGGGQHIDSVLLSALDAVRKSAEQIDNELRGRDAKTANMILNYCGKNGEDTSVSVRKVKPLRNLVQFICSALPGAGNNHVFEFDTALICSVEDSGATEERKQISRAADNRIFLDNVAQSAFTTLRNATRVKAYEDVAKYLIDSLLSLGLKPDTATANKIKGAAEMDGLDPQLKEETRRLADTLQPRGMLAGDTKAQPFTLPEEFRDSLADRSAA